VLVVDEKNWPCTLGMKSVPLDHPLYGLSVRSANCLQNAGLTDKAKIRSKIQSGELRPYLSIRHYGTKTHIEVCRWLGLSQMVSMPRLTVCPHCGGTL
jgi:hypothetical protein